MSADSASRVIKQHPSIDFLALPNPNSCVTLSPPIKLLSTQRSSRAPKYLQPTTTSSQTNMNRIAPVYGAVYFGGTLARFYKRFQWRDTERR
ncbi:hypothetical protein BD410DRAFT_285565 [Rickenella mellea]|uniref:Uncharacterized protein n=1 Tax=Rickenella mellea TaxID=50990 RepID=A0A4Y7Q1U2_9AGAM|nr:hypothetical protein BD410DRAFT_285565 [Rickenella mellea]